MQTKEYTFIDRSGWPKGQWDDEPDKVQWQDKETGLPCIARRTENGHWCGYVGIAKGHLAFEKEYNDIDVLVHGGLTYASFCDPQENEQGICHVPDAGELDHVWWLGFDCNHCDDFSPGMAKLLRWTNRETEYRTLEYVKGECTELARQLASMRL